MKSFLTSKRRFIDLLILATADIVLYLIWRRLEIVTLFSLGFIWNWVAAQDLHEIFENKRYRFSMVKMVTNLQTIILQPFEKAPKVFHALIKSLPAGIFWGMVILFNESHMPWWATFIGSFFFELSQIDQLFSKRTKEQPL